MYEYFEEMENGSFLEHHGILGQKWGIRRFQNYDGTLKAAGKKRRSEDRVQKREERKAARAEKKEAKAQGKAEKKEAKAEEARKNLRADIDKAIANVDFKKISELKGQMTDDDLLKLSKRAQALGKTAENLDKYKKGLPPSTFDKVIKGLGAVKTGADAVVNAHKAFTSLREEFGLDTKSILNSVDDSDSNGGSKSNEPDIFDRALKLAGSITKDAANKANEKYQQRKYEKQLKEASDRIKDNETLNWLENLNGKGKEKNEDWFDPDGARQRKLQASVSGHGKIDQGFKLKDGDWSMFRNDTPKPTPTPTPTPTPKPTPTPTPKPTPLPPEPQSSKEMRWLTPEEWDRWKPTPVNDIPKQKPKSVERVLRKAGDVSLSEASKQNDDYQEELRRRNASKLGL